MKRSKMLRNRLLALALVGAFVGLLRWLAPAPAERAVWLYLVALPLGYGHLIGAAVFSCAPGRRSQRAAGSRWLASAFAGSCVLSLLAIYTWALQIDVLQPWVLIPMLLLSAWHIAENDLALGCAYRDALRLGGVAHTLRHHGIALVLTAGVGVAALATPEGAAFSRAWLGGWVRPWRPWFMLDELASAVLLYHAVSWLIFFEARACALRPRAAIDAARLRRRVFALHAVPLALNAALYLWLPAIHFYVAAPALYLFWSVLHAIQTAAVRGLGPRTAAA
jgi:hypothetical protein